MGITHSIIKNQKPYLELQKAIKELNGSFVKSGFPEGKEVGVPNKSKKDAKPYSDMSEVSRIAVWNEFGTDRIPSRPFFRNAIDGNREKISTMIGKLANLAMIGRIAPGRALENLGLFMQSIIRASIRTTLDPPNAPRTIKAKHSSHPLIDTGQMINSVTFVKIVGKNSGSGKPEVMRA